MSPEKLIKYSLPFFVFAYASRAVEEISFIYYAVPVMCLFFIVQLFKSSKFYSYKHKGDPSTPLRMTKPSEDTSAHSAITGQASLSVTDSRRTSFAGMTKVHLIFIIPGLWFSLTSLWSSYPEISAIRALYFILISPG